MPESRSREKHRSKDLENLLSFRQLSRQGYDFSTNITALVRFVGDPDVSFSVKVQSKAALLQIYKIESSPALGALRMQISCYGEIL